MGITQKQIAELAGVSIGTVDRALHDRGRVDPKVAVRIKQIAKELGYRPNSVAQSLSILKRNLKIGVILHIQSHNAFFDDIIRGILKCKEEISDFGIAVEIKECPDFNAREQLKLINQAVEEGISAIAIVPINHPVIKERLNELHKQQFPVVFLTNIIDDTEYLSFVGCNYNLTGSITAGLLNLVCPKSGKLLLFSPSFQMLGHIHRMNGLKTSLEQEYPQIHLQDVIEMTGNDIKDYQLTRKALEEFPDTNVIVCPGGYSCGNLQAIQEMGYFKSSRIICYDSSAEIEKELRNRNITATIIQQPQLQGYTAVRTLFEYLSSGKSPASKNQFIQTRIILKENLSEI
ncbi:LacI family DNA-binding transcriptional regulator [Lacrimispora sp.]|uniref:LacI family DNA-binding transcriptional regulator n=1 Tax=Lacrimispora sp. TaxID=2719234 RepID=UPI002FDA962B